MTNALTAPSPTQGTAFSSPVRRCSLCRGALSVVLDLGEQPLANGLLDSPDQVAPTLPLRLAECQGCRHVQLAEFAPPEAMFGEYVYRTGASAPMRQHFRGLAEAIRQRIPLGTGGPGWVCDVGSNDGTLLTALRETRPVPLKAIGVDPSSVAREVEGTLPAYFNQRTAANLLCDHGPARAVTMCNVLAHTPDPLALIEGARDLLSYGGVLVIEVPYLYDLMERGCWDTIYHEHGSVFSAAILQRLLIPNGFAVEKVERLPVHGGSLRVWARRVADVQRACYVDSAWLRLLESEWPIDWEAWAARAYLDRAALQAACDVPGLVAFGAPAKATVLLNWTGIRPAYAVDSTEAKTGKFIPGTGVEIRPESEIGDPPALLLCAWNYQEDILARYPQFAGRWIIPFPARRA